MSSVQFDAYDPAFVADPYPTYARLREAGPFFDDHWRVTFFARHADWRRCFATSAWSRHSSRTRP